MLVLVQGKRTCIHSRCLFLISPVEGYGEKRTFASSEDRAYISLSRGIQRGGARGITRSVTLRPFQTPESPPVLNAKRNCLNILLLLPAKQTSISPIICNSIVSQKCNNALHWSIPVITVLLSLMTLTRLHPVLACPAWLERVLCCPKGVFSQSEGAISRSERTTSRSSSSKAGRRSPGPKIELSDP